MEKDDRIWYRYKANKDDKHICVDYIHEIKDDLIAVSHSLAATNYPTWLLLCEINILKVESSED